MNMGLDHDDEGAVETTFRDVIMLCLMGFISIVMLLLPHLNPPGSEQEDDAALPGNLSVELFWNDESASDLDLWVQAPGDVAVGYSNKGGSVFNLLRDDLGNRADVSGRNFETAYTRGIPAGEYTINVHHYRGQDDEEARIIISMKATPNAPMKQILVADVTIDQGEELTVVRFTLDADHKVVTGSVHNLQKNIRGRTTP